MARRVKRDEEQQPVVLPTGAFGEAVARHLATSAPEFPTASNTIRTGAHPVVLATWRFSRVLARELDQRANVPWWFPVSYMHPEIQIGPIFASDLPGCHECLEDRLIAGDPKPEYTKAFWETYDQDPKAGTRGFLEHHALIAAGLARSLAEEAPGATRSLYTYHVLTGEIIHHTFVPVSTCPRWRESGLNETTARKGEVL